MREMTDQERPEEELALSEEAERAHRQALRENTKRVLQDSQLAEMLKTLNRNALKGRGSFEEFDALIIFRWGTAYTRRHLWIEIVGNTIRFRMNPHLRCSAPAPLCDGEYHTFTRNMWANPNFLLSELNSYYQKPV